MIISKKQRKQSRMRNVHREGQRFHTPMNREDQKLFMQIQVRRSMMRRVQAKG